MGALNDKFRMLAAEFRLRCNCLYGRENPLIALEVRLCILVEPVDKKFKLLPVDAVQLDLKLLAAHCADLALPKRIIVAEASTKLARAGHLYDHIAMHVYLARAGRVL